MEGSAPTLDELLAHEAWLRRLVRRLVDDHEVDDVVQETWTAALASGSALARTRAWLGRVAHNLALRTRRGHARRRRRESHAARPDEVPSTVTMLARIEAHRQVAEAVASLDEPYRTAVLLRYFEQLSPAAIAEHLGVEPSTVRSRLQRGLSRLRGRLEREGRDLPALAALVLARPPASAAPLAGTGARRLLGGTTLMTTATLVKTAGAAGLLALAVLAVRTLLGTEPDTAPVAGAPPGNATASVASAPAEPPAEERAAEDAAPGDRRVVAGGDAHAVAGTPLRGRVLDRLGRGVPGVELAYEQRDDGGVTEMDVLGAVSEDAPLIERTELGASGLDGSFEFVAPSAWGHLRPSGSWRAVRVFTPRAEERAEAEALVLVAPTVRFSGRVLDENGAPIEGAALIARIDGFLEFPLSLERAATIALPRAWSDAEGRFLFDALPGVPELYVECAHDDHAGATVSGLEHGGVRDVVLGPKPADAFRLRGTVVDTRGRLVPEAYVALGESIVRTDRYGAFEVSAPSLHDGSAVVAGKPGLQACIDFELAQSLRTGPCDVGGVTLTIGPEALTARGRVVDPDGAPLEGLCLTILDGTAIQALWTAEDVARGVEPEITSEGSTPMKVSARTDADGAFRLEGLGARTYRVRVFDPKTLVATDVTIESGSDTVIELDPDARFEQVRGIVRDRRGAPVPGASVFVKLTTWNSGGMRLVAATGAGTKTDEAGAFTLTDVPRGPLQLDVSGEGIADTEIPLAPPLADPLEIEVLRRCAFRVALSDTEAEEVALLDADGNRLELQRIMGQISMGSEAWQLRAGRTPVLHVTESARTLVLLRGGEEVSRRGITLDPAHVTVIE